MQNLELFEAKFVILDIFLTGFKKYLMAVQRSYENNIRIINRKSKRNCKSQSSKF